MGDEFNKLGAWEDAWQQAFEGSEHTPPTRVWQQLENSLMEQQLRRYKRKLYVYQWLAAASVMLLGIWVGWWMLLSQAPDAELAQQTQAIQAPLSNPQGEGTSSRSLAGGSVAPSGPLKNNNAGQVNSEATPSGPILSQNTAGQHTAESAAVAAANNFNTNTTDEELGESSTSLIAETSPDADEQISFWQPLYGIVPVTKASPEFASENTELASEDDLLITFIPAISGQEAKLMLENGTLQREIRVVPTNKKGVKANKGLFAGDFWLGASVGRNFFDPNMSSGNSYAFSRAEIGPGGKGGQVYTANVSSWDELEESIPSLDFKLDAAYRISKRWMLQSSLQYNTFKVKTLTGSFTDPFSQRSYPLYYTNFSSDKLQTASANSRNAMPVAALTSYNFLSVPVTLNFVLFERQLGFSINSGISSEIFIGGRIKDQESMLNDFKLDAGSDSPFRKVHLNALLGAQLFYKVSPRHVLTLEPTYRHSISDFHKENNYFDSRPKQFGVAAGFRFILH